MSTNPTILTMPGVNAGNNQGQNDVAWYQWGGVTGIPTFKRAGKASLNLGKAGLSAGKAAGSAVFSKKGLATVAAATIIGGAVYFPVSMWRESRKHAPAPVAVQQTVKSIAPPAGFDYVMGAKGPVLAERADSHMFMQRSGISKMYAEPIGPQLPVISSMYDAPIGPTQTGAPMGNVISRMYAEPIGPQLPTSSMYAEPIGPQLPATDGANGAAAGAANGSAANGGAASTSGGAKGSTAPVGAAPECTYTTSDKKLNLSTRAPLVAPSVFTYTTGGKTFHIPVATNQELEDVKGGFKLEEVLDGTTIKKGGLIGSAYTDLEFKRNANVLAEVKMADDGVMTYTAPEGATAKLDAKYNSEAVRKAWGDFKLDAAEQKELGRRRAIFTVQLNGGSYLAAIVTEPGACAELPASTTVMPVLKQYAGHATAARAAPASTQAAASTAASAAYPEARTTAPQSETSTYIGGASQGVTGIRVGVRDDCDVFNGSIDDVCADMDARQRTAATSTTTAPAYDAATSTAGKTVYVAPGQTVTVFDEKTVRAAAAAVTEQQSAPRRGGISVTNSVDTSASAATSTECGYTAAQIQDVEKRAEQFSRKLHPMNEQMNDLIIAHRDGKISGDEYSRRLASMRPKKDRLMKDAEPLIGEIRRIMPCYDQQTQEMIAPMLDLVDRMQKY